jgi:Flp pilus assembly protein TadB
MTEFPTKIATKKWKDHTPEELLWCIDNEPGTGANHQAAAQELQRRNLDDLLSKQAELRQSVDRLHRVDLWILVVGIVAALAGVVLLVLEILHAIRAGI